VALKLQCITKLRAQAGLPIFIQDDQLTRQAERIASRILTQRENIATNLEPGTGVLYYASQDPNILPKGTEEKIKNDLRNFHRIGIGIVFGKSEEFPIGAFWVAIFLKE